MHDEMTTLCDVYWMLQPSFHEKRTSYVLQTLWRDLTSEFDIVGPHYTSEGTMTVSVLLTTHSLFVQLFASAASVHHTMFNGCHLQISQIRL